MWLKKLKKKKMQFFIITLVLLMSTAILTACFSFTLGVEEFVDDYYAYDNCPALFAIMMKDNGEELLRQEPKVMDMISKIETNDAKVIQEDMLHEEKKLRNTTIIVNELKDRTSLGYSMDILKGEETKAPGDGEIWICNICAKVNDLSIGDTIQIDNDSKDEYKVSAIISTPECCSGFINCYPYFVNPTTFENVKGNNVYALNIYLKSADISEKEFGEAIPTAFTDEVIVGLGSILKMCLTILSAIFGGVGIAAAIIVFVVTIIIIRYMIRATLAKEFHMIGIYKAIGKDNKEIVSIYFKAYMAASLVGILLGVFAGIPLTLYLANIILGGLKGFKLTTTTITCIIICALATIILLAFNIWEQLRKVHKITPIQAMQHGMASSKEKLCKSLLPNAHSPFAIAVNNLVKNKTMSLLITLVLTVSFYLCLVSCSIGLTLSNYTKDKEIWENFPKYDGYICYEKDVDYTSYLDQCPLIDDYVRMGLDETATNLRIEDSDMSGEEAHPLVYENFTLDRYKDVPFTDGRICINPHEIAVSKQFLSHTDKKVGDYLTIGCNDKEIDFLIVGKYSAMMKGGISFYMLQQDWEELGNTYTGDYYLFFLKDGVTYDQFKEDFKANFKNGRIGVDFGFVENEGDTVSEIANPISIVLFLVFASFSILNIVNLLYTSMRENRRKYGILKAMGFTTKYIIAENLCELGIQCAAAIVVTCILQELVSPSLFSIASGVKFVYKPVWLTVAVCGGMLTVILVIAILMLLPARKISPVELMEE